MTHARVVSVGDRFRDFRHPTIYHNILSYSSKSPTPLHGIHFKSACPRQKNNPTSRTSHPPSKQNVPNQPTPPSPKWPSSPRKSSAAPRARRAPWARWRRDTARSWPGGPFSCSACPSCRSSWPGRLYSRRPRRSGTRSTTARSAR